MGREEPGNLGSSRPIAFPVPNLGFTIEDVGAEADIGIFARLDARQSPEWLVAFYGERHDAWIVGQIPTVVRTTLAAAVAEAGHRRIPAKRVMTVSFFSRSKIVVLVQPGASLIAAAISEAPSRVFDHPMMAYPSAFIRLFG